MYKYPIVGDNYTIKFSDYALEVVSNKASFSDLTQVLNKLTGKELPAYERIRSTTLNERGIYLTLRNINTLGATEYSSKVIDQLWKLGLVEADGKQRYLGDTRLNEIVAKEVERFKTTLNNNGKLKYHDTKKYQIKTKEFMNDFGYVYQVYEVPQNMDVLSFGGNPEPLQTPKLWETTKSKVKVPEHQMNISLD